MRTPRAKQREEKEEEEEEEAKRRREKTRRRSQSKKGLPREARRLTARNIFEGPPGPR